ncbi:MAG: hypothetical protein EA350_14345 [Gemmatimonadales bacterium]|nr:MAG: hypothetical protein EA350_14345 [Gemmatimonadales bacterium]
MKIRFAVLAALGLLLGVGCDNAPDAEPVVHPGHLRDSAGVRVVEHDSIPSVLPTWTLSETPDLRIGSIEGEGPDVLGSVGGGVVRSDGVIVVGELQTQELRAFSPEGEPLWVAGGPGQGPGELVALQGLFVLPGDSVLVQDWGQDRASVFDPSGAFVRSFWVSPHEPGYFPPRFRGLLPDGTLVAEVQERQRGPEHEPHLLLAYYDTDGRLKEEPLGPFPFIRKVEPGLASRRVSGVAGGGTGAAVLSYERLEVRRYEADGTLSMIVRAAREPAPVDAKRLVDEANYAPLFAEAYAAFPLVAGAGLVDSHDRTWVRESIPAYDERTPVWWVFGPDGKLLARATFPEQFSVIHIERDHIVGVNLDEWEVPYLERRVIVRTPPPDVGSGGIIYGG